MDPPEAVRRYFGSDHKIEQNIKLPKGAHPFAHVFEGKSAVVASDDREPAPTTSCNSRARNLNSFFANLKTAT